MDHCVSAFSKERKQELYQTYVTDVLRLIGRVDVRYDDWINPKPVDTRSADDIIDHIKSGLKGLKKDESI